MTFFGEPRGLAYLAFTEAWERFSYYGMTAILVLYMSQSLLLPGHVEHVTGFGALRSGLEAVFGPLSTLALASQIFGLYTGFIYFTPVFGGLIADRWMGRRNAVMVGALLMSAGHIAMAFEASFLAALLLLIVGCGLLKGNISVQVGELYAANNEEGRTRGYSIFSVAINVGAVFGPLVCGGLAQWYGWHAGFGVAGLLMLIGLATYMAGYRHLPEIAPARRVSSVAPMGREQRRGVVALLVVMTLTIFTSIASYQIFNIGVVWVDQFVDLNVLGVRVPAVWLSSVYSFACIVAVPVLFALWRSRALRDGETGELARITTGAWLAAAANVTLMIASLFGHEVSICVAGLYAVMLGISFLYYWPPLLALVSRAAPLQLRATLMGTVFLSLFVANILIGWLGGFYEQMVPAGFWAIHGVIAAFGGILMLLLKGRLERILQCSHATSICHSRKAALDV